MYLSGSTVASSHTSKSYIRGHSNPELLVLTLPNFGGEDSMGSGGGGKYFGGPAGLMRGESGVKRAAMATESGEEERKFKHFRKNRDSSLPRSLSDFIMPSSSHFCTSAHLQILYIDPIGALFPNHLNFKGPSSYESTTPIRTSFIPLQNLFSSSRLSNRQRLMQRRRESISQLTCVYRQVHSLLPQSLNQETMSPIVASIHVCSVLQLSSTAHYRPHQEIGYYVRDGL